MDSHIKYPVMFRSMRIGHTYRLTSVFSQTLKGWEKGRFLKTSGKCRENQGIFSESKNMEQIINKEDKLKSEITSMEQHLWHKDEGLPLVPKMEMDKNKYDSIISELKIVGIVKKEPKI